MRVSTVIGAAFGGWCVLSAAACTKSPAAPSDGAAHVLEGRVVSALDGAASAGVQIAVGSSKPVTTDAAGNFAAALASGAAGSYSTVVTGPGIVERRTTLAWPSAAPPRVSLIPASFDLQAFDEMFRTANGRLQRWTSRPALVVLGSVMSYRGDVIEYSATSEQMSADEVTQLVTDLTDALAFLTGNTYTSFASVDIERPSAGERASTARPGVIVVGRFAGVQTFASTIGYGRWAEQDDGAVFGGAMFLDRNFDRDDSRRRLLRFHELGHALGYLHVESRVSIMNPSIGPEPTAFDRAAAIVAFERPVGNVPPDTDPGFEGSTGSGFGGRLRWSSTVAAVAPGRRSGYCAAIAARPPRSTNF